MYLVYVDESGDPGPVGTSPTAYFGLSALMMHERDWHSLLAEFAGLRRQLQAQFGLLLSDEIHASAFISQPGALVRIRRNDRLAILKKCLDWCATRADRLPIVSLAVDKAKCSGPVFDTAWQALAHRLDHALLPGPDLGLVFCDNTDGKLTRLFRHWQQHPLPLPPPAAASAPPLLRLTEDPIFRDSRFSYFHQLADVVAYFARQTLEPNSYLRRKGASGLHARLAHNRLPSTGPPLPPSVFVIGPGPEAAQKKGLPKSAAPGEVLPRK